MIFITILLTTFLLFSCTGSIRNEVNHMPKEFTSLRDYGKEQDDKTITSATKLDNSASIKDLKKTLANQEADYIKLIEKLKMKSYTLYLLGIKYKESSMYYEALDCFEKAIKANPSKDMLYYEAGFMKINIANTLANKDEIDKIRDEAKTYFNEAIKINPKNHEATFALATMLSYFDGNFADAEVLMAQYSKLTTPNADSLFLNAYISAGLGQYNSAASYYEQIEKLKNIDSSVVNQAKQNRETLLSRITK